MTHIICRPSKDEPLRRQISDTGFAFRKGDSANLMAAAKEWQGKKKMTDATYLASVIFF